MMKRIEFTLNLDDPQEAALYRALSPALRYRRAGSVIRQALQSFLLGNEKRSPIPISPASKPTPAPLSEQLNTHQTHRIVEQSAAMFGF